LAPFFRLLALRGVFFIVQVGFWGTVWTEKLNTKSKLSQAGLAGGIDQQSALYP
jgi:hypothetical protein